MFPPLNSAIETDLAEYCFLSSWEAEVFFIFTHESRKARSPPRSVSQLQDGRWKPFLVKPLPSQLMKPLLVFVNPKSGGNQVSVRRRSRRDKPKLRDELKAVGFSQRYRALRLIIFAGGLLSAPIKQKFMHLLTTDILGKTFL